jgi:ABC-2 type transport system ATP-binding protein
MITVKGLHKKFKDFQALKGVDMHVSKGEIYGFIGHNGAGKSTVMNILAGLSHPTKGDCIVNGKNIKDIKSPGDLQIGYLPEDPRFYPWMTSYEILKYLGGNIKHSRITEILKWVGLSGAEDRRVGGFSRGMKQRLGIGAALIRNPSLLILDEPSSALDPEGRSDVLRLITEMKKMGKTVIFSTHILSDVERVCDTVGMIAEGSMVIEKPLEELQKNHIRSVFDITLDVPYNPDMITKIRELNGVIEITSNGCQLSVTTSEGASVSKALMRFFVEYDITIHMMALRKNNLEELFLTGVTKL